MSAKEGPREAGIEARWLSRGRRLAVTMIGNGSDPAEA